MYCGLDFGTSNSLCAVESTQSETAIRYTCFDGSHVSTPSAVFYKDGKLNQPIFGREAIDLYLEGVEGRLLRGFKRLLGTQYFSSGTMLSSRQKLKFQDLFVAFIRNIKDTAEQQVKEEITHVVFGRPVKFSSFETAHKSGEEDLAKIANLIGFRHVEFQLEPIASAFSHEKHLRSEKLAIVTDIGGGTSDFSVIRLGPNRKSAHDRTADILANTGVAIGGTDFDSTLALGQIMPSFGYLTAYGQKQLKIPNWPYVVASDWNKVALELYRRQTYLAIHNVFNFAHEPQKVARFLKLIETQKAHHLLKLVEEAKIELSDQSDTTVAPDFIEEAWDISLSREQFEQALRSKVETLKETIQAALTAAQVKTSDIEFVILTGGASAVPMVQQSFLDIFPHAELSAENKLGSVCEGLLYDARRKFGMTARS